ncbi:D-alanine--D-alanine ligase family protein [Pseudobutyrivibrio ruminis]|uniref:D-alanine--D-alanine ligase n=1 Tax=Pseudobutyrivibrio ruminis DSM 9787 TaxID=1123011 RepID=A0A285RU96_9FIRM|nr:D-alanine--D-alanine ligase [Pseudobutyrivibrio ruminis]MBE5914676.1 D-alanine--D-alanine ligase [Pseudobutyrivibrio ruminis]SOB97978.1 D-alanine-D-alanine ligase [Pseudobutyrivibrio ruminis DSM 9787]
MDIVVLAGGLSSERDVSFKSGSMVAEALRARGHRALVLDVFMGYSDAECDITDIFEDSINNSVKVETIPSEAPDINAIIKSRADQSPSFFGPNVIKICQKADIVFMALHGGDGESGKVQAAFDLYGIKYTGNDYISSAIAMDKQMTKEFFNRAGVPTPVGTSLKKANRKGFKFDKFPCIVKPNCGGSSIGVTIVEKSEDLDAALDAAFEWEDEVVIEQFIKGREFSDGVMEGKALPVIEIAPKQGFYDYKNKYAAGSAVETCPADISEKATQAMKKYAEMAFKALGLTTYARMDFMMDEDENIYCLEANTLPGMTPTSLLPQEAKVIGMDFEDLCEHLIKVSLKKY